MKSCETCGSPIPYKISINGVVKYLDCRNQCLKCKPFRQIKRLDNGYKISSYESVKAFRKRKKERMVRLFGGKCMICGYNKTLNNLSFHHKDPTQKDFTISSKSAWGFERLLNELKKCIMVCHNCHGEIHAGLIDQNMIDKMVAPSELASEIESYQDSVIPTLTKEPRKKKYIFPSVEDFQRLVWQKTLSDISIEIGCGLTLVREFCKLHKITTPPFGYWHRRKIGLSHDKALQKIIRKSPKFYQCSQEDIQKIISLKEAGHRINEIGRLTNRSHSTIIRILKRVNP